MTMSFQGIALQCACQAASSAFKHCCCIHGANLPSIHCKAVHLPEGKLK
jgi:hypothetical protein